MNEGPAQQAPQTGILVLALHPKIVRSALIVAIIVGTILNLINQGDALLTGTSIVWWKICLTYLVPYCVSTYGAVTALRSRSAEPS